MPRLNETNNQPLWPMEMVYQVKRCWAETFVDDSILIIKDDEWNIKEAFFYSFQNIVGSMVQSAFIDIRDCLLTTNNTDFGLQGTKLHISWGPETKEVEFNGGPANGMALFIPKMGDPYKVSINHIPEYAPADDSIESDIPKTIYILDGWNPNTRRWIYRPK